MVSTVITRIAAAALAFAALTTLGATTAHAVAGTTPITVAGSNPWE
ncbi:hypothetical protein SAMN04488074_101953 [Lentzea albidocapillata subsp. violacea]|uniref:Uncharacterized protein n=1 Tax=Lentzea albidocapillata subsp. violacea TaxID=128104 RepID=A0A1G8SE66_9PSEU|nr:hypothetical protein [Lentzea albidocapillata]SDJ27443.1 hypothetical protein SAMN04488074_101953 [Lentzea albidocapillata subsp. violacea]